MCTCKSLFQILCIAIVLATSGVGTVAADDVPMEVLLDLNKLTQEQLDVLDKEIDKAEERWLSLFVEKRTFPNRGPRTASSIRSYFKSVHDEMAKIRISVKEDPERWKKRPPDAKVIPLIYEKPRRALDLVWKVHIDEASQRVNSLDEDQKDALAALYDEREKKVAELKRRFGFDTPEYRSDLWRYDAVLKRKRERERKEQMRQAYAEATEQLLAVRRLLCGEAWRWMDIARRREDIEDAQKFTAFVYLQFDHDIKRRPLAEREAILGKGNTASPSVLGTWRDLRYDRLDISTFFLWEPQETLRMYQALASEPVESLRKFDDSPLPDILEKNFRIVKRIIEAGSAEAVRLQRELREAEERTRRALEDYDRAEAELKNKRGQLEGIEEELVRLVAERDAAIKRSRDLAELAKTAQQQIFEDRIAANEQRIGKIIQRLDAIKTMRVPPSEERDKLIEEYDSIQKDQVENQKKLADLRTEPPEEVKRQEELAKEKAREFWEAMRWRSRAETEVSLASEKVVNSRKELFAAEQQVADLRDQQARAGVPLEGKIRDIWIRSADTGETYYQEESFFSLEKRLADLEKRLKDAAARCRLIDLALEERTKEYQKFSRERNLAGADLEAAMKRSGGSQMAFETAKHLLSHKAIEKIFTTPLAILEGILEYLHGGFKIEEVDFASAANINWNEAAMTGLPPGFIKAVRAKDWRNAFSQEVDQYLTNDTSLEELGKRLESLGQVRSWLDSISVEIDPLFLALMVNFGEEIDAFFRSEAVAKLVLAQVRASIATMLFQKTSLLAQEAFADWRALQRVKDKILAGHEARTGLVLTEKKDFPRDANLEIFIGHDEIEQLNLEVELGGQKAQVMLDTLLPKEGRNQPARWFKLTAQEVRRLKDDGKGGVELKIRAIP